MATRIDLIAATARAYGLLPIRSVNVLAMMLGKAGLIRTAGRGLNAARMGPSDAVALLTAAMSGGPATEAAETTGLVLAARMGGLEQHDGPGPRIPPLFEAWKLRPYQHSFGDALTELLTVFIEEPESAPDYVEVSVERASHLVTAVITFSSGGTRWNIHYFVEHPELAAAASRDDVDDVPRKMQELRERRGGGRETRTIDREVLVQIAACLRDGSG